MHFENCGAQHIWKVWLVIFTDKLWKILEQLNVDMQNTVHSLIEWLD